MLAGRLKAVILLNNEPEFRFGRGRRRAKCHRLNAAQMVVTLSPFKANIGLQRRAAADRAVHRNRRAPS
jgi:NADH-quinone oxidoreductase subunit G